MPLSQERAVALYPAFAHAVLQILSQDDESLAPTVMPRLLPSSIGGKNILLHGHAARGPYLLKIRIQPHMSVASEASVLAAMPEGLGPSLWTTFETQELVHRAVSLRRWDWVKALDLPVFQGLLCEWLEGEPPVPPMDMHRVRRFARQLAAFHQLQVDDMPRLSFPRRHSSMMRVVFDQADELAERGVMDELSCVLLEEAVESLESRLASLDEEVERPVTSGLCHGDLRWHNVLIDAETTQFVDVEDAGVGDPAIDLAMMTCRTPLTWPEELTLLEQYERERPDIRIVERYFAIRDSVGLLCALGACLDICDVLDGQRLLAFEKDAWAAERWKAVCAEWRAAVQRILGPSVDVPLLCMPGAKQSSETLDVGVITFDGPSGCYKTPLAQRVAFALGIPCVNTGALYRYVALWALCHDDSPDDAESINVILAHLDSQSFSFSPDGGLFVDGCHLMASLSHPEVDSTVASWSCLPEIRSAVSSILQDSLQGNVVADGRDVGTHLAPDARWKFFVDAPAASRADALCSRTTLSFEQALAMIHERDQKDRERLNAPFAPAPDAISLVVTPDTFDTVYQQVLAMIEEG
jgi:cytidylate kinase